VASGRVDLHGSDHERGWRALRAIRGIGSWTIQMLALTGQGRLDQLPAGDLAYLKLVGRLRSGGDPHARASEDEVDEFFAPYAPWAGLAGMHALRAAGSSAVTRAAA
jgi:DNA-3-methyladenine glycosylase II/AraC family transcriptional regulator of adaptative response / DNA-3-methyladenine glycosylase II